MALCYLSHCYQLLPDCDWLTLSVSLTNKKKQRKPPLPPVSHNDGTVISKRGMDNASLPLTKVLMQPHVSVSAGCFLSPFFHVLKKRNKRNTFFFSLYHLLSSSYFMSNCLQLLSSFFLVSRLFIIVFIYLLNFFYEVL